MIIPGFSNYDISEDGVVTKLKTGKVLTPRTMVVQTYYTYVTVTLIDDDNKRHICNVLRLLALTYLDKPKKLCTARAKDGDNTNTVLSNVEWVPYTDGAKKAWARRQPVKKRPNRSCVTEDYMAMLYDTMLLYDEPVSMGELSRELDVPYSVVRYTMYALIDKCRAKKTKKGFKAIK